MDAITSDEVGATMQDSSRSFVRAMSLDAAKTEQTMAGPLESRLLFPTDG